MFFSRYNNVYSPKGKLGFAVIKVLKTSTHNIILYDSNKTTLSSATVTSTLEVTVKGSQYVSYYDDNKKYWSLYGTEEEIQKVIKFLKSLGVGMRSSIETDSIPPKPINKDNTLETLEESNKHDVESDADSINKKSKAALLSRMATMGHSVLPTLPIDKSSDSSDTNEPPIFTKIARHKPVKSVPKRPDKPTEIKNIDTTIHSTEIQNVKTYYDDHQNRQIIPLPSTSIITTTSGTGNDMNLFMTEQRICNSELRINMSRITDKVDQTLAKLTDLHIKESNSNNDFNTEILQKLLREYENKIKTYENMLKNGTQNLSGTKETSNADSIEKDTVLKNRISDLESIIKDKNDYVLTLKNEIQAAKEANSSQESTQNNHLSRKVLELERELSLKNEQIIKETNQLDSKVKAIMNDTYHVIANNFESNENYSGDSIKNIVAKVIKKVTTDTLNKL